MKAKIITILLILVLVFGAVGLFYYNDVINHPFKVNDTTVEVRVEKGQSLYNLLGILKNENKIKSEIIIKAYIKNKELPTKIKPGLYEIETKTSIDDFINIINKGLLDENQINVTIPEGYEIKQIAETLEDKGIIEKEEFIKSVVEYPLPDYIKPSDKKRYNLEGYIFPDTYKLKPGMKGEEIISIMLKRFEFVLNDIQTQRNDKVDNDEINKIITMASIVEKEAYYAEERPKVAAVFYNRLKKGMRLQSDITVLYALDTKKERVLYKDLEIDSPYNTYKVDGLPIGPVCNPGRASIEAALEPEKSSNLYFIIAIDGPHIFTDSYEEFLKAKNEWIKNR